VGSGNFSCPEDPAATKGILNQCGNEGGFAPQLRCTVEALDLLCEAIVDVGFHTGTEVALALDVAASELYHGGVYTLTGWCRFFLLNFIPN